MLDEDGVSALQGGAALGEIERARGWVVEGMVRDVEEEPLELVLYIVEGFTDEEVVVSRVANVRRGMREKLGERSQVNGCGCLSDGVGAEETREGHPCTGEGRQERSFRHPDRAGRANGRQEAYKEVSVQTLGERT